MNFRNEQYDQDNNIICEYEHPTYGWIPFTASSSDIEQLGKDLYAEIVANGSPSAYIEPAIDLPAEQTQANILIDQKATEVRGRFISFGGGQEMIYMKKEAEAQAFKDAGYPEANISDYPLVEAEAIATSDTGQQAADAILTQAAIWIIVGANIERERRIGKINVEEQLSIEGIQIAVQNAVNALDLIS